jgi:hypothetical protein
MTTPPAPLTKSAPSRLLHLATLVAVIGILDAFSAPGFYTLEGFIFLPFWLLLMVIWCLQLTVSIMAGRPHYRRRWAVAPIACLVCLALIVFEVPMRIRFALSQRGLTELMQQVVAAGPTQGPVAWGSGKIQPAGAYDVIVHQVTSSGEVDLIVSGTFLIRSCSGFVYCPSGPPFDPEGSLEPLGGAWYVWHTSW